MGLLKVEPNGRFGKGVQSVPCLRLVDRGFGFVELGLLIKLVFKKLKNAPILMLKRNSAFHDIGNGPRLDIVPFAASTGQNRNSPKPNKY